jgi:radical SAM superfamily enzyme YgiQ (UPF0313 family)
MKILFVLPFNNYGLEPLGLLSLGGALRHAGHRVTAVTPNKIKLINAVKQFEPDIVMYSVITGWHLQYLELNNIVKLFYPKAFSIFGGPHATFFPEYIYQDGVDAICRGEGELSVLEFVSRFEHLEDYTRTSGFWVKDSNNIYKNNLSEELEDLNQLTFPDRTLLEHHLFYINPHLRAFIASRGCSYDCSYCFNHAYRNIYKDSGLTTRVRIRSVENLIREMDEVRNHYRNSSVAFFDDIFPTKPDWLDEFSQKYSKQIQLPFECNLRIEQITPRVVTSLRQAGCAIIAIGIETEDRQLRATILRRKYGNEDIIRACTLIREQGILLKTYNILGIPPGDLSREWNTMKFNSECSADIPTASLYQPYPGTDLGEDVKRRGDWDGNLNNIQLGFYNSSPIRIQNRGKIEVLQKLFPIGVKAPVFRPIIWLMMNLASIRPIRKISFHLYRNMFNLGIWLGCLFGSAKKWSESVLRFQARLKNI